jgi:hypothetical protein
MNWRRIMPDSKIDIQEGFSIYIDQKLDIYKMEPLSDLKKKELKENPVPNLYIK